MISDFGFFDHDYPYTNFHELNLDWILRQMIGLRSDMKNFVNQNTIKYADPIQWNITTQYEANTVVIEPNSGNAYISSQPVPAGVAITNEDYWSVIGNFSILYESIKESIAAADDGSNINATEARAEGSLLWLNSKLYKVLSDISIGALYITSGTGQNLEEVTIEELLKNDREDITILQSDVSVINSSVLRIGGYIDNLKIATPEMFGALGDGVTDDSSALKNMFDSDNDYFIFKNQSHYMVRSDHEDDSILTPPDGAIIDLNGSTVEIEGNNYTNYKIFDLLGDNIHIKDGVIVGDRSSHIGASGEWGMCISISGENVYIENIICKDGWGDGIYIDYTTKNVTIDHVICDNNRRNGLSAVGGENITICNSEFNNTNGVNPQFGIDLETNDFTHPIKNVSIYNVKMIDNVGAALGAIRMGNNFETLIVDGLYSNSRLKWSDDYQNPSTGTMIYKNITLEGVSWEPLFFENKRAESELFIDNIQLINCHTNPEAGSDGWDGIIHVRTSTSDNVNTYGGITITNMVCDFSGVSKPAHFMDMPGGDKKYLIDCEVIKAVNIPCDVISVNSGSNIKIRIPKNIYEKKSSNVRLTLGSSFPVNIMLTGAADTITVNPSGVKGGVGFVRAFKAASGNGAILGDYTGFAYDDGRTSKTLYAYTWNAIDYNLLDDVWYDVT